MQIDRRIPRRRIFFLAPLWLCAVYLPPAPAAQAADETLIVFHQNGKSELSAAFKEIHLPRIREIAEEQGVGFRLVDASQGAPADVAITPLIVFQNHRGRSIFQGRYASHDKVAHFIRTARAVALGEAPNPKKDIAVWRRGRAVIASPIKITALSGSVGQGHDEAKFAAQARDGIVKGFKRFEIAPEINLRKTDRAFYMDFHPYRAEDGRLFVSTALYSQFSCIDPIYTGFDDPVASEPAGAEDWAAAFARAASLLEAEVGRQLRESEIGDGFDTLDGAVAVKTWEELGLALPSAPDDAPDAAQMADLVLPAHWVIEEPAPNDPPRLQFRFPPPLDSFAGEAARLEGALRLTQGLSLEGARGHVAVENKSVTMGDAFIDEEIHEDYLLVEKFTHSRFELESAGGYEKPLQFGETAQFTAQGYFEMIGVRIPVQVRAEIEPRIGPGGGPQLGVNASFRIRLFEVLGEMIPGAAPIPCGSRQFRV